MIRSYRPASFSLVTLLATLLASLLSGCQSTTSRTTPPQIDHVVLIWLKQPGNELVKADMAATARALPTQIPGIVSMTIGDALPGDRPMVDTTFDMALVMRFVDAAALRSYETHPVHVEAVTTVLQPNSARVVIYDIAAR